MDSPPNASPAATSKRAEDNPRLERPTGRALPAALLDFERAGINLGEDIAQLQTQYKSESYTAVLFFCGRILECLTAEATSRLLGEATANAASNLRCLTELMAISPKRWSQLSVLHYLATDAVLARRTLHRSDADCALLLLDRLLTWFFVELEVGPQLPTGGRTLPSVHQDNDPSIAAVLLCLESTRDWLKAPEQSAGAFLATPAIAALYIDKALLELESNKQKGRKAIVKRRLGEVMTRALRCFNADVRLRQLHGRVLGLEGDYPFSVRVLKTLNREHPGDSVTLSLLANQLRRHAEQLKGDAMESAQVEALQAYQRAWNCSQETDSRCGLQAAILGLRRGRTQRAESIASSIVDAYTRRWVSLGERFEFSGFQDVLILAHASLILGEAEYARRRYREAFEQGCSGALRALVKQEIRIILSARGLACNPQRFLDGRMKRRVGLRQLEFPFAAQATVLKENPKRPLRITVTGRVSRQLSAK